MEGFNDKELANLKYCHNETVGVINRLTESAQWVVNPNYKPTEEDDMTLDEDGFRGMIMVLRNVKSFLGSSLIHPDRLLVRTEINTNLQFFARDGQEQIYLSNLNEYVGFWKNPPVALLRDKIKCILHAYPKYSTMPSKINSTLTFPVGQKVRSILKLFFQIFKELYIISDWIIFETNKSLLVTNHADRFPHLVPFTPPEEFVSVEPGVKLLWKGDKTDLAELIWALTKSGRIVDSTTGQDVTQKELINQFINLFGISSLDVANLMKGRYGTATKPTTFKVQDGKTFINTLQTLLNQRILD